MAWYIISKNFKLKQQIIIQHGKSENMAQYFNRLCMKVSTGLVFMLLLQQAGAQYNFSELDTKLNSYSRALGNNVATMIYKDGKIIYTKEQGDFTINSQEQIASCSKWLSAALVMTFVDEGKISLEDTVGKYLQIFSKYGKGNITIRECLCHETGIESAHFPKSIFELVKYKTLEEEVNDIAKNKKLIASPGKEFRYGSVGLNTAGRILEIISGRSFEELMQEKIFIPLDMTQSSFEGNRAANPSGGAKSTASDYMHFLEMILNKGVYNGKRILSEASVELMQQSQTNLQMIAYAPKAAEGFNYAFGEWVLDTDNSGKSAVVASPGLFGTWPLVDLKRGYVCIFFVKNLLTEQRKDIYTDLKNTIDKQIPVE